MKKKEEMGTGKTSF